MIWGHKMDTLTVRLVSCRLAGASEVECDCVLHNLMSNEPEGSAQRPEDRN